MAWRDMVPGIWLHGRCVCKVVGRYQLRELMHAFALNETVCKVSRHEAGRLTTDTKGETSARSLL